MSENLPTHRLLLEGETIQDGDEVWFVDDWQPTDRVGEILGVTHVCETIMRRPVNMDPAPPEVEDESSLPRGTMLLLDSNRGVHIPRDFADLWWENIVNEEDFEDFYTLRRIIRGATGLPEEQSGLDYANECWQEVVDKARLKINDKLYTLHEEGDLWAVPMAVDAKPEPGIHDMYGDEIADLRQMALEDKLSILRDNAGNPAAYIIKGQEAAVRNMIS